MKTCLFRKYRRVHQINGPRDTGSFDLEVGQPGDAYERQADAVADSVVMRPATAGKTAPALAAPPKSAIQMKCAECEQESLRLKPKDEEEEKIRMKPVEEEEEEKIQMKAQREEEEKLQVKPLEEEEEKLQLKPVPAASANKQVRAPAAVARRIASSKGQGRALPAPVHAEMGSRIGADFSAVRIHTDHQSVQLSEDLGAQAFTHGHDIYFNAGKYDPATASGKHLLAHELAHVVQQHGAPAAAIQRKAGAARCSSVKTVSVNLVKLSGSNRNPSADLAFANRVFRPGCVRFSAGRVFRPSRTSAISWLGGDTDLDRIHSCSSTSTEEDAMRAGATTAFGLSSRIRVFYVDSMTPSERGVSFPPYCASGSRASFINHAYISNQARRRSLAHEFGHILLNSGVHPATTDNLMHPTNTATGEQLTASQQTIIFANA